MSNTSRGNQAEKRGIRILAAMGYEMAARAKGNPVWKGGRVIASDGPTDLCRSSIDAIFRKRGHRTLFVQFCHIGGESPRRALLRAVDWDANFEEVHLWAWDAAAKHYRVYRDVDDFLQGGVDGGWRVSEGDMVLPWDSATVQTRLGHPRGHA